MGACKFASTSRPDVHVRKTKMGFRMRTSPQPRASFFGIAGSIIGLLALIAATLPQWALPKVFPPQAPEQITVDVSPRLKDRIVIKLKGLTSHKEERSVEKPELDKWSDLFSIAAMSLVLIAMSFAVISVARQEPRIPSGVAAGLGAAAIAFQVLILAAGLAMTALVLYALSKHLEEISYIAMISAILLAVLVPVASIPGVAAFLGVGAITSQLTIIAIVVIAFIILCNFFDLF